MAAAEHSAEYRYSPGRRRQGTPQPAGPTWIARSGTRRIHRLAGDFPQLNWVREEWFGQGRPDGRCLGPFELASQLRAAQRDRLDELLLISFDPFGMVVEGVTLELAGEAHA